MTQLKQLVRENWKNMVGKYLLGLTITFLGFFVCTKIGWIIVKTDNFIITLLIIFVIAIIVWTMAEIANWVAWIPALMLGMGGCPVGCGWLIGFCLILGATLWSIQEFYPSKEIVVFSSNIVLFVISFVIALICLSIRTATTEALSQDSID